MAAKSANALPERIEATGPGQEKASLAKLLSHPTRVQILAAAHRQAISPSEFARAHGQTVSSVAQSDCGKVQAQPGTTAATENENEAPEQENEAPEQGNEQHGSQNGDNGGSGGGDHGNGHGGPGQD